MRGAKFDDGKITRTINRNIFRKALEDVAVFQHEVTIEPWIKELYGG